MNSFPNLTGDLETNTLIIDILNQNGIFSEDDMLLEEIKMEKILEEINITSFTKLVSYYVNVKEIKRIKEENEKQEIVRKIIDEKTDLYYKNAKILKINKDIYGNILGIETSVDCIYDL